MTIRGVGPNEPIVDDGTGYKSAESPYRMDIMPGAAILHVAAIMCDGAKTHGENNWHKGSEGKHLNKALVHLMAYIDGDQQDDHLGHAAWRVLAALQIHIKQAEEKVETTEA